VFRGAFAAGGVMGQGTNLTTSDLPCFDSGIKTYGRVGRLSGNTDTVNAIALHYNMESQDCYRFIGKTVILSFYYRTGANFSATNLIARIGSGTGTDQALRSGYTGYISQGVTNCAQNTSWSRISLSCTFGTTINQIGINFEYAPTGTAAGADYFDITGVQLELGSVATPFEVRPYPVELGMCQRYYEFCNYLYYPYGTAYGGGYTHVKFSVVKRGTPSVNSYDAVGSINKISALGTGSTSTNNIAIGLEHISVTGFVITAAWGYGVLAFLWSSNAEM